MKFFMGYLVKDKQEKFPKLGKNKRATSKENLEHRDKRNNDDERVILQYTREMTKYGRKLSKKM